MPLRFHVGLPMVAAAAASLLGACGAPQGSAGSPDTRVYRNVTGAMEPTLRLGQTVVVTLFDDSVSAERAVRRGELVLYAWPPDTSKHFIKRLIGMPGDTLDMRGGVLHRNGAPLTEPYAVRDDTVAVAPLPELAWSRRFSLAEST